MPEWVKVLAGCLVIIVIGASAPILIIDGLYLRQHRSPEINRTAKQESAETANPKKASDATNNSSDQPSAINPTKAAIDNTKGGSGQTERGAKEEIPEAYFHIGTLRFKTTDSVVAFFTALQFFVGAIQAALLYFTVGISRKAADAAQFGTGLYLHRNSPPLQWGCRSQS